MRNGSAYPVKSEKAPTDSEPTCSIHKYKVSFVFFPPIEHRRRKDTVVWSRVKRYEGFYMTVKQSIEAFGSKTCKGLNDDIVHGDDVQQAQVLVAQSISASICIHCGRPGTPRPRVAGGHHITPPLCHVHNHDEGNTGLLHRFALNDLGRDFVVGDLHGHVEELERLMAEVEFDTRCDRLFSVGDLIDRGPSSAYCVYFLIGEPWFHAVRGNHEQDLIDYAANRDPELLANMRRDGAGWIDEYMNAFEVQPFQEAAARDAIDCFARQLDRLPYLIEIETPKGLVGIIHADFPAGKSWGDLCHCIEEETCDPSDSQTIIQGRSAIHDVEQMRKEGYDDEIISQLYSVNGLYRLYSGHTSVEDPVRVGNRVWIDTGIGWLGNGRMTLEEIT